LIDVAVAPDRAAFSFVLNRKKLRKVRLREGRYLLRTNLCGKDPAQLWQFYIQLVEVEAAFKTMKDDLHLRPIYHQLEQRIEARRLSRLLSSRHIACAAQAIGAGHTERGKDAARRTNRSSSSYARTEPAEGSANRESPATELPTRSASSE
jgi:hypothetical protein